jgi:hypothetical protein
LETSYGKDLYRQIFGEAREFQVRESIDRSSVSAD